MFDWRNTSVEIRDAAPALAILPLAAIEQHGPHLPLATDLVIMNGLARRVAEALPEPAFLLPTFPYGTSLSQAGFAGTLWLTADTLLSVVRDTVESLHAHGVQQTVVLNNHCVPGGTTSLPHGNFVVKTAVRQLNYDHPAHSTVWVQPLAVASDRLTAIFGPGCRDDVHAGTVATSILLHLREDLVQGTARDFTPAVSREYLDVVALADLCPDGVWGRPEQASAERGTAALTAAVECTVAYIETTLRQLAAAKARDHAERQAS
ncbi:MAG: creatininase family protein [Thermomicrobiales bacterium]